MTIFSERCQIFNTNKPTKGSRNCGSATHLKPKQLQLAIGLKSELTFLIQHN